MGALGSFPSNQQVEKDESRQAMKCITGLRDKVYRVTRIKPSS